MNGNGKSDHSPETASRLDSASSGGNAALRESAYYPAQESGIDRAEIAFVNRALAESNYSADELFAAYRRMSARLRRND